MGKRFLRASCIVLLGVALAGGAIAESRWGILRSGAERDPSLCEVKLVSEFMATKGFGELPEFLLSVLAADGLPLAKELRAKLDTTTLDANGTEKAVADMLIGIAGDPNTKDADDETKLKEIFVLKNVFQCTMFGVGYGRFTALRRGVTEDKAVDCMVTAYASAALDGLIAFLSGLPQPEVQPTTPQPEVQPTPPAQQPEKTAPSPEAP
jgi:hypothetical protein